MSADYYQDLHEPAYRKVGKRYQEIGFVHDPYKVDGKPAPGLWFVGGSGRCWTRIARLEDLPCPAVVLGAVYEHAKPAILERLRHMGGKSIDQVASEIVEDIARLSAETGQKQDK
jgi:hypothetical protein